MQGHGVDVHGNGMGPGRYDLYGRSPWQCVELAARLYRERGWGKVFAAGNSGAAFIPEGSPRLQTHSPGSGYMSVPGDLIVEHPTRSNAYGHVAVVDRVEGNTIHAVEQNGPTDNGRHTYT